MGMRTWAVVAGVVAGIVTFSVIFATYVMNERESNLQDFKEDCSRQGGEHVELYHSHYCLINGEKIQF